MQKCEPQEQIPWAPKFEERTQDETLEQERCARREAWDLANNVKRLKKEEKGHVLLTCRSLGNAGTPLRKKKKPEVREFVVDSGASMHMLGNSELETLRRFRNPTTVVTANGEVYVHDLELFVTVQLLEDTLALVIR